MGSSDSIGLAGAFAIPFIWDGSKVTMNPDGDSVAWVIASDGQDTGWDHVSCHLQTPDGKRTPNWEIMCAVKDLFWDETDCVIQFHPPKADYVNKHPNVLHLWRKVGVNWETPPKGLIG